MISLLVPSLSALIILSSLVSWIDVLDLRPRGWQSYEEGENPGSKGLCGTMLRRSLWPERRSDPGLAVLYFKDSWLSPLFAFSSEVAILQRNNTLYHTPAGKEVSLLNFQILFLFLMHACVYAQLCTHVCGC